MRIILGTWLVFLATIALVKAATLEEHLKDDLELSEFYSLIERNKVAVASLKYRSLTLFAPTNQAFQKYPGNATQVLYHMSTAATMLEKLEGTITSDMEGNPPLYITRKRTPQQELIYINNALVLKARSNLALTNEEGRKQVLHVIDDVLQPLSLLPGSSVELFSPDAFQFLTHSESLDIGPHRLKSFRKQVILNKRESVYKDSGAHTYFVPVDEGFKPPPRSDIFDHKVIDSHIIPSRVIFTAAAPLEEPLTTLTFEENLKVQVTIFTRTEGKETKMFVKSQTVIGDSKHGEGVVLAEIVRANIPVKNGVVHLISRPLMIVDTTVEQFLQDKQDGPLFKFYEVITQFGGEFMKTITNLKNVTLLAPSNEAWIEANLDELMKDKDKIRDILNLHLVKDRLNTEKIKRNNMNAISQVPTNDDRKFLYFNIVSNQDNQTVTVEGGGVNATIIQPDIAATNGFVHIIDRVLGSPYTTLFEKMRSDPMLNSTYHLGMSSSFNQQLGNRNRKYTFFVPRDKAWVALDRVLPSLHKKLFMPDFAYHTNAILERHLIAADRVYSMADLMKSANNSFIVLKATRGELRIKIREEEKNEDEHILNSPDTPVTPGYSIQWRNRWINVFRPDVQCTNGVIHVIDFPLVDESDVVVTRGSFAASSASSLGATLLSLGLISALLQAF